MVFVRHRVRIRLSMGVCLQPLPQTHLLRSSTRYSSSVAACEVQGTMEV